MPHRLQERRRKAVTQRAARVLQAMAERAKARRKELASQPKRHRWGFCFPRCHVCQVDDHEYSSLGVIVQQGLLAHGLLVADASHVSVGFARILLKRVMELEIRADSLYSKAEFQGRISAFEMLVSTPAVSRVDLTGLCLDLDWLQGCTPLTTADTVRISQLTRPLQC